MPKPTKPTPGDNASADALARRMDELAAEVQKQLPGWQIAREQSEPEVQDSKPRPLVERGASLSELRRKFLPDGEQDTASDGKVEDYAKAPVSDRESFRVEPEGGGPAKVADLDKGKLKLVQG